MPPEKDKIEHFHVFVLFSAFGFGKVSKVCCVGCVGAYAQQILRNTGICAVHIVHEYKKAFQLVRQPCAGFSDMQIQVSHSNTNLKNQCKKSIRTLICYLYMLNPSPSKQKESTQVMSLYHCHF